MAGAYGYVETATATAAAGTAIDTARVARLKAKLNAVRRELHLAQMSALFYKQCNGRDKNAALREQIKALQDGMVKLKLENAQLKRETAEGVAAQQQIAR